MASDIALGLKHLTTTVHARFQIDVVTQFIFTGMLVFLEIRT